MYKHSRMIMKLKRRRMQSSVLLIYLLHGGRVEGRWNNDSNNPPLPKKRIQIKEWDRRRIRQRVRTSPFLLAELTTLSYRHVGQGGREKKRKKKHPRWKDVLLM